jgi:membrane associated rhomboid family serine protease
MFPYHDENETQRTPVVTMAIIGTCVAAWFLLQGAGAVVPLAESVCNLGLIPGELLQTVPVGSGFRLDENLVCVTDPGPQFLNVLTSMFLHGGWMHLLGNMWFLWLFGNNIEDSMSRPRFVVFYLACGVAAALAQVYAEPDSIIPMVGASGAISGVMGGYLVLSPRVRVFDADLLDGAAALWRPGQQSGARIRRRRVLGTHRRICSRCRADQDLCAPGGSGTASGAALAAGSAAPVARVEPLVTPNVNTSGRA